MFFTYILQSIKDKTLYIGYTNDLTRRFKEHNQGLVFSTKPYKPWRLIYYEACINQQDSKRRENYFKTTQGRRLLKRRLKEYFYSQK